jgi:hypothetical protein
MAEHRQTVFWQPNNSVTSGDLVFADLSTDSTLTGNGTPDSPLAVVNVPISVGSGGYIDALNGGFGLKADTQLVTDVTITVNSSVVSCPNNDCNFTQADVGKIAFAMAPGAAVGGILRIPQCTIISLNSPQSINVSHTSSATIIGAAALILGSDDTAALEAAFAAVNLKCGALLLPASRMLTTKGQFNNIASRCRAMGPGSLGRSGVSIIGWSSSSTQLVLAPNFDATTCNGTSSVTAGSCFFGSPSGVYVENVGITSFGSVTTLGNHSIMLFAGEGDNSSAIDVTCTDIAPNDGNTIGIELQGFGSPEFAVNEDGCGGIGIRVEGRVNLVGGSQFIGDNSLHAVVVSGVFNSYGNAYNALTGDAIAVGPGSIYNGYGDVFDFNGNSTKMINNNGGTVSCSGCEIILGTVPNAVGYEGFGGGSRLALQNTKIDAHGTGSHPIVLFQSGDNYTDLGGNTFIGPNSFGVGSLIIADGHQVKGIGTGNCTASQTLGLYGTGPNVTATTCTSTTIGSGIPVSGTRTLTNLICSAAIAGTTDTTVNALVNGSVTAVTCTIAAGTLGCSDGIHTVALSDGDLVSLEIVTGAATTPSGINASVMWV